MHQADSGIAKLELLLNTDLMERAINLLILCRAMQGKNEEALALIERGINAKLPMMIYVFIEPILKPLHSDARFQESFKKVFGDKSTLQPSRRKKNTSLLNEKLRGLFKEKLGQLMLNKKPFIDADLSLRSLADMMEIPANQLSQLLSEGFNKNFAEYVNSYRLEYFKSLAADSSNQRSSIAALAHDSGFNSETAFNTFFIKAMGVSPETYWKELKY